MLLLGIVIGIVIGAVCIFLLIVNGEDYMD